MSIRDKIHRLNQTIERQTNETADNINQLKQDVDDVASSVPPWAWILIGVLAVAAIAGWVV